MGKGSRRRPQSISDAHLEDVWNSLFATHPNDDQFEKLKKKEEAIESALNDWGGRTEDDYGNVLPKTNDPDRFVDDIGDA